jgi:hypothetical protein
VGGPLLVTPHVLLAFSLGLLHPTDILIPDGLRVDDVAPPTDRAVCVLRVPGRWSCRLCVPCRGPTAGWFWQTFLVLVEMMVIDKEPWGSQHPDNMLLLLLNQVIR